MISKAVGSPVSCNSDFPEWLLSAREDCISLALLIFHSVTVLGSPILLGFGLKFWQRSVDVPGDVTRMNPI